MLTQREIIKKVYELVDHFYYELSRKHGIAATHIYYQAIMIAGFCRIPKEDRLKLFGDTTLEEPVEGLFRTEDVNKAQELSFRQEKEYWEKQSEPVNRFNIRYVFI